MNPESSLAEDRYLVGAILQAYEVLRAFRPGEYLRLRDIVDRTSMPKATAFRVLRTLHRIRFVEQCDANRYRLRIALPKKEGYRLGFDYNGGDTYFAAVVHESLVRAAASASGELLCLDNRDGLLSFENAKVLVKQKVDLAIVFHGHRTASEAIAEVYRAGQVPVVAIDVPLPGAYFFGANNYRAGILAGKHLGKWTSGHWAEPAPDVLLLEYRRAGALPQSRVAAMMTGFRNTFRLHESCKVFPLDTIGDFSSGYEQAKKHLRQSVGRRTLIAAVNDASALGAMHAYEEAGRADSCTVISQDGSPQGRAEMRIADSRLLGSVAYFPERYGERLMVLVAQILGGLPPGPPPATFTRHVLLTAENVDRLYPSDGLLCLAALKQLPPNPAFL